MTESLITEDPLERQPVRDFKFRSAFSLSFADLSPIVGIYTVFAIGLIAAGPAFLWAFPLVLIGQLFVCGLIALAIGFTSSMIAVQTAVTRAIWASARDRLLPGEKLLGRLSGRENLPRYAIGLTVVIAGGLIFAGASKVFALLVSFSAFGFILSYYLPIVALGYKQWRGQSPTDDAWGARWIRLVTAIAVVWLSAEIVNLLWPRPVNSEWYLNWGSIIMTVVLGALGGLIALRNVRRGHGGPGPVQRTAPVAAEAEDG